MEIFFGALNSRKGIQGTFFRGQRAKVRACTRPWRLPRKRVQIRGAYLDSLLPAEPVKISRKKEKCSYECTDNSKTDIKDVANRKNPLYGTGGNARRRRSRIDVF